MKDSEKEGSTAHKQEPGPTSAAAPPSGSGPMPMGMVGGPGGKDPDQKSTHVAPKTVEATLPDGSPTYADPGTRPEAQQTKRGTPGKAGKYEVVSPITTKVGNASKRHEVGEVVELSAEEAGSLGAAIKPA